MLVESKNFNLIEEDDDDPEEIGEILRNKNLGCMKKIYQIFRTISLFKVKNGIHHKKKLYYTSKCSVFTSSILIVLLLFYTIHKITHYGDVVSKNTMMISIRSEQYEYFK